MASYDELSNDYSMLGSNERSDLQLAAELGKTLLERNKELETSLRNQQKLIDEQTQEIECLTKQTLALREVNDSRLRIYEQLEVNINDLERTNYRLKHDNSLNHSKIKTLTQTNEALELKCEELQRTVDDTKEVLEIERRKNAKLIQQKLAAEEVKITRLRSYARQSNDAVQSESETEEKPSDENNVAKKNNMSMSIFKNSTPSNETSIDAKDSLTQSLPESNEIIQIVSNLEIKERQLNSERQKVLELEEQIVNLIQENQAMQHQIAVNATNGEMKSIHEELSILDEVRGGPMCSRCLRSIDDTLGQDDVSSYAGQDDDIDQENDSVADLVNNYVPTITPEHYRTSVSVKMNGNDSVNSSPNSNLYKELVQKYEALVQVQQESINFRRPMELQHDDQITSGEFSSINTNTKDTDEEYDAKRTGTRRKLNLRTTQSSNTPEPLESETASSGFSDEICNKSTQTEGNSFLCTIGDGENGNFSIYGDASPFNERFRVRPEYRELFKEIFLVLKKAAENKDKGEKLPLLDDGNESNDIKLKVPPVTPATENLPDFTDETISVISSILSESSVARSELITKQERKLERKLERKRNGQENMPPAMPKLAEDGRLLTPLKRNEPLEYISVAVRRKNKKKFRSPPFDRSDSPILPKPPMVFVSSGKKRKDRTPLNVSFDSPVGNRHDASSEWNGHSMTVYNRSTDSSVIAAETTSANQSKEFSAGFNYAYKPGPAAKGLQRLRSLDLTYAEVLKKQDRCHQKGQQYRRK